MTLLTFGLVLLLGTHTVPMSPPLKQTLVARLGGRPYKILFLMLSGIGLLLIVIGFSQFRGSSQDIRLWSSATWSRDVAYVLMLPAFILLAAAFSPSHIRQLVGGHPLLLGVILWAITHLITNGHLAGLLLFGGFLLWALLDLVSVSQRGAVGPFGAKPSTGTGDIIAVVIGCVVYALMLKWGHPLITGIPLTG